MATSWWSSPAHWRSRWRAQHGVELIASRLEIRDGIATGRYLGAQCAGVEKARLVRERYDLAGFDTIHAYGDTPEDEALLALAHRRWYRGQERTAAGGIAAVEAA